MTLADVERRLLRRYGERVRGWLDGLPALLRRLAGEWDLDLGEPLPGGNSAASVAAVRAGAPVVLKVFPDVERARAQVAVLRAFLPSGRVPAVLAAGGGAFVVEWVAGEPGWPPVGEFAALLADLHSVPVVDRPRLGPGAPSFVGRARPDGPVTAEDLAAAGRRCREMASSVDRHVLLHGDLHAGNVLVGPGGAAVVIDPHGTVGEPEFDAVDHVLGGEGIERRRDALLAATALRPERLEGWCRAVAAIVALGAHRQGRPTGELLDYARSAPRSR
ncbi:phosphotransferase [Actinokineospora guangxiensis]|uniref:Phosphotransferase n=1 Tax=Actinokineospora guangxiensis TaxID=1490288 RepID=A0ABW0EJS1_9PSEU